jgi:hypothetical protein
MDDFFLQWLKSVWPVLVPTVTIGLAYLGLKRSSLENRSRLDQTKEVTEGIHNQVMLAELRLQTFIDQRINGKLERIDDTLRDQSNRLGDVEKVVSALNALMHQRGQ